MTAAFRIFKRASLRQRIVVRFATEFDTKEQLNDYLKAHPKADRKKHKVRESDKEAPKSDETYKFDDAEDVGRDIEVVWGKNKDAKPDDKVSQLAAKLLKNAPVTRKELADALAESNEKGKNPLTSNTIQDLLEEMDDKMPPKKEAQPPVNTKETPKVESPAESPKPEEKKPDQEPVSVPKETPKEDKQPQENVKPTEKPEPAKPKSEARKGSKLSLPKPADAALVKKLDSEVSKTKLKKPIQVGGTSHVTRLMKAAGVSPELVDKAERWSDEWVYGGQGAGTMEADKNAITDFMKNLEKPNSWARAKYEATQATIRAEMKRLQKEGIMDADGYVTLYRGVRGKQAKSLKGKSEVDLEVRPLSSWSDSASVANKFADDGDGVILSTKIHYTRIAGMWSSEGYYWTGKNEHEWTVLSDNKGTPATVMSKKGAK